MKDKATIVLKECVVKNDGGTKNIIIIKPVTVEIDTRYVANVYDFTLSYRLKGKGIEVRRTGNYETVS